MLPNATFMNVGAGPDASVGPWAPAALISDYQPSYFFVPEPTIPFLLGLGPTGVAGEENVS